MQLQLVWVDVVLHKIFPIVVVLDWILDPPMTRLTFRDALLWLVFPLAWIGLTLVRGAIDGWYPYPFLDPANGGYGDGGRSTVVARPARLPRIDRAQPRSRSGIDAKCRARRRLPTERA